MVDKTAGLGGAFCGVRSRCSPTRRLTASTKAAFSDGDRSILPMALITVHRAHCSSASSIVARAIGCAAPRAPTQCQRNDERCVILHESGAPWLVGGRAEQRQPRIEVAASDKPFAIEAVGVGPRKCPAYSSPCGCEALPYIAPAIVKSSTSRAIGQAPCASALHSERVKPAANPLKSTI